MSRNRVFIILGVVVTILACGPVSAVTPTAGPSAETPLVPVETETMAAPPATEALPPATEAPPPTATSTSTPLPSSTPICDRATFISETYPDGSDFAPGATFTKTWRLRNAGACTWTASYDVVLDSGNPMGAALENPLAGNVAPGQEVDISIVMQAPASPGNYQGNWKLRNGAGVLFGLGAADTPFWANIDVVAPTATPTFHFEVMPHITFLAPFFFPATEQVYSQVTIAAGATSSATVSCPSGSVVVGGGFAAGDQVVAKTHSMDGNGWRAYGKNFSGSSRLFNVYAICLSHTSGSVAQQFNQVSVAAGGIGHAVATCPAGSVVTGGGYASNADAIWVYNSSPHDNGWEVYGENTSGSSQLLNAYAICLSGTSGVKSQVYANKTIAGGASDGPEVACPSGLVTGGGFALSDDLVIYNTSMKPLDSNMWHAYARNTGGSNRLMNAYAVCITFP